MNGRLCTRCEQVKAVDDFAKDSSRKSGYQSRCKACDRAYKTQRKERISEKNRQWYENNKERKAAYNRAYYREHIATTR